MNLHKNLLEESDLDLVVAGTRDGALMVESEANELDEKIMLGAVQFGFKEFQSVIDKIIESRTGDQYNKGAILAKPISWKMQPPTCSAFE